MDIASIIILGMVGLSAATIIYDFVKIDKYIYLPAETKTKRKQTNTNKKTTTTKRETRKPKVQSQPTSYNRNNYTYSYLYYYIEGCKNKIEEIRNIIKDFNYFDSNTYEKLCSEYEKSLSEIESEIENGLTNFIILTHLRQLKAKMIDLEIAINNIIEDYSDREFIVSNYEKIYELENKQNFNNEDINQVNQLISYYNRLYKFAYNMKNNRLLLSYCINRIKIYKDNIEEIRNIIKDFDDSDRNTYEELFLGYEKSLSEIEEELCSEYEKLLSEIESGIENGLPNFTDKQTVDRINNLGDKIMRTYDNIQINESPPSSIVNYYTGIYKAYIKLSKLHIEEIRNIIKNFYYSDRDTYEELCLEYKKSLSEIESEMKNDLDLTNVIQKQTIDRINNFIDEIKQTYENVYNYNKENNESPLSYCPYLYYIEGYKDYIKEIRNIIKDFYYSDRNTYEELCSEHKKLLSEIESEIKNGLPNFIDKQTVDQINNLIDEINRTYKNAYNKKNNESPLSYIMETEEDIDLIKKININDFK